MSKLCILLLALALSLQSPASALLNVDGDQVVSQLLHLATFTDDPNPAVTRVLFTDNDMKARTYIKQLMKEANLQIREDAMGNIFGRWQGEVDSAVLTGSHCDAIPLAGAYDGTLGVVGAIAAIAALRDAGFEPHLSIEVMMFTSEEPTRFGLSCVGSRAMAGALTAAELDTKLDANGTAFLKAANAVGYGGKSHEDILQRTKVPAGRYSYFVELHIEQGPELEAEGLDIGVVTAIAAPAALEIEFFGDGGHAGAQLMHLRNDAGLAAAEVAIKVEEHTLGTGARDTVGTTGIFEVGPNAINSVPRHAKLGIDVRDIDGGRRDGVVAAILDSAATAADRRHVRWTHRVINQDPPATSSTTVVEAVEEAAEELQLSSRRMVSRAYHDSLFLARVAPTAMIFVPCRNGWSHRPDEFASPKDVQNGVATLALTLARLSAGSFVTAPEKQDL